MTDSPDIRTADVDEIRLALPAAPTYARVARLAVAGLGSRMGYSYDEIEDLRIAVGEICNVLVDGTGHRLEWRFRIHADALEVDAARVPKGAPVEVGDLTDQILQGVVDSFDVDHGAARVRVVKRRQG